MVKNLLLVRTAAAATPPGHTGSTCAAGGSLVARPASLGTTSGWLHCLRTREGRLVLFVIVVDNPHKSAMLGGLTGQPLAHRRVRSRSRWDCFRGRLLHSHQPLSGHSIISGQCWTVLVLVAAGVLVTPSNIVCWRVHPSRMVHTGCQRHVHCAQINISYLQHRGDKSLAKEYSIQQHYT